MGLRDLLKRKLAPPEPRPAARPLPPPREGFTAVAAAGAVRPDHPGTYQVGPDVVAVFRVDGALFAIHSACAHEDGPLGEGAVSGGIVTCPYHNWRYDVRSGACLTHPGRAQACYAVRETDGFLWVGPRTREGTGERGGEHDDGLTTV